MHGLEGIRRANDEQVARQKRFDRLRAAGRLPQPATVRHKPVCVAPGCVRLAAFNPRHVLGVN